MDNLNAYIASDIKIRNDYYRWLCDLVSANEPDHSYFILIKELHKKEFYSIVPNDDNRGADGIRLRSEFLENENYVDTGALDGPCSVLEMLIALSIRMGDELYNLDGKSSFCKWFWVFIEHLGLDELCDDNYIDIFGDIKFAESMDIFLNRKYSKNGNGGLFPLKKTKNDQRTVEIWYQMQEYLNENFKI